MNAAEEIRPLRFDCCRDSDRHRRRSDFADTIDNLLDRLGNMREEMVAIERSLERINAAKREPGKDKPGKQ
jgi:hypothetical protein